MQTCKLSSDVPGPAVEAEQIKCMPPWRGGRKLVWSAAVPVWSVSDQPSRARPRHGPCLPQAHIRRERTNGLSPALEPTWPRRMRKPVSTASSHAALPAVWSWPWLGTGRNSERMSKCLGTTWTRISHSCTAPYHRTALPPFECFLPHKEHRRYWTSTRTASGVSNSCCLQ